MAYFICSNCGYGSASWMGKCPDCGQWNTLRERPDITGKSSSAKESVKKIRLTSFNKISPLENKRKQTGLFEFDRVLGGGLIPGEAVLLTGEPGIGKSTLLLQSLAGLNTVYVSGEESAEQVKERAERLKINLENFLFGDDLQVEGIIEGLYELKSRTDVLVIDSIQTVYSRNIDSTPGSVSQLRDTAGQLIKFAKKNNVALLIIGHVTKEGEIAGPKTLEHMVDCVINFEGEKVSNFRILRAAKNRFGPTDEIGIFEMKKGGLAEVNNPLVFLENEDEKVAGKAITGVVEGKRTLFFEIQSLTSPTFFPIPKRVVRGVDYNKVILLLAVIKKHLRLPLDKFDIYVNVIGGVNIKSTAADLAIMASIISSIKNVPIAKKTVFTGEVGLLGEVRKVPAEEKIISEASRLRFERVISSKNLANISGLTKIIFP